MGIAVLTVRTVFARAGDLSPAKVLAALERASPPWMLIAMLCMAGFIVFEGLALLCILRHLDCPAGFFRALQYSAADQFFSAVTPSASGGQPAAALTMRRHQIPGGIITTALILNLVLYTASALVVGIACLTVRPGIFRGLDTLSKALVVFGITALTALTFLFLVLLKKGRILYRLGRGIFQLLHKLCLMQAPDRWCRRLGHMVSEYESCARAMEGKPGALASAFLLNLAQRISQITVTLALHCAMNGSPAGTGVDLWVTQALAQIGSNCVPIPGGMGAADYLMLDGFRRLFPDQYAYQLQILSRCVSFYACTLLSGLIVLAGFLAAGLRRRREKAR